MNHKRNQIIFETVQCWVIVFIVTPGYFFIEMALVRPKLVAMYSMGDFKHMLHVLISGLCFINVAGNMAMTIAIDSSTKRGSTEGDFCDICKIKRSPDTWHCKKCNVCIDRRDHHCMFLARCIGLHNQRYYLLFLFHLALSMVYAMYYNYFYVQSKFEEYGFMLSVSRIINPMLRIVIHHDQLASKDLYVLFWLTNIGLFAWSGGLFYYHMKNVIRGVTYPESVKKRDFFKNRKLSDEPWRENVQKVFGIRWYWALVWPFAKSPLLGLGKVHRKID